jgi:anti-anti-sigma regulatory factor
MTLKVNSSMEGDAVVFALCGRIREAQVADLDALFTSAKTDRNIIVDIANVKLIDRAAVRFLAQQEDKGFTLRNCPAYIREWISRERSGSNNQ